LPTPNYEFEVKDYEVLGGEMIRECLSLLPQEINSCVDGLANTTLVYYKHVPAQVFISWLLTEAPISSF